MYNNRCFIHFAVVCFAFVPSFVLAGAAADYEAALNKVCSKTQQCAQQKIAADTSVPADMKTMIAASLEHACSPLKSAFAVKLDKQADELLQAGAKCLKSMQRLSCNEISNFSKTPACQQFDSVLEKY